MSARAALNAMLSGVSFSYSGSPAFCPSTLAAILVRAASTCASVAMPCSNQLAMCCDEMRKANVVNIGNLGTANAL
eukprot:gene28068-49856_t